MCTLVVAVSVWGSAPLVVAANRDELLARPASPPHRWAPRRELGADGLRYSPPRGGGARDDEPEVFAPRDLSAGGTWLGIRGASLFVGITNRFMGRVSPPGPRSRGELVLDALAIGSVEGAADRIAGLDPAMHNPFHLVIADRRAAHLVWNDGVRQHHEGLPPGLHVITERSRGAAPTERDGLLRRRLEERQWEGEPSIEQWRALLSEHAASSLEGPCVHADDRGYGTRCSTVVRLPAEGGIGFFHADGRPCVTPYVDLSTQAGAV
jgi:uncharacterized protein with NRDE domain